MTKSNLNYLLRDVDGEERSPPPMPSIAMAQISETPILPGTPLPLFSPEVVVDQPNTPRPSQQRYDPRPPPLILCQRVSWIVMNKHHRYHCPIRVNHLHQQQQQKVSIWKTKAEKKEKVESVPSGWIGLGRWARRGNWHWRRKGHWPIAEGGDSTMSTEKTKKKEY